MLVYDARAPLGSNRRGLEVLVMLGEKQEKVHMSIQIQIEKTCLKGKKGEGT